jgi:hypothetical protein
MKGRSWAGVSIAMQVMLGVALSAGGCASTEMTSSWTDPSAKGRMLSSIAVVCLTSDPGLRRMGEDNVASRLTGAQAVPSYRVLGDTDLRDRNAVKKKLNDQGFQGVLVMRVTRVNEQVTAVGGPYGTFDGYYDYAGAAAFDPAYLQTDTVVHVVSNLYSLQDNKLIWSGVSQTFDPASVQSFIDDVGKAVAKSMQKERLVL